MKLIYSIFLFLLVLTMNAQTIVEGVVMDEANQVIPGANIFVKGGFDGASSQSDGRFRFSTSQTGKIVLMTSFMGFETKETVVEIASRKIDLKIILVEKTSELTAVTVTAGSFEASDDKKAVLLKPIDIITVANSVGDVIGAMATLPGAQRNGNDGFLVVRGGDGTETKTFVDGLCVEKPYTSRMPDLPARGRFSPMLFKGTMFSTGGFSAQYGQALSSVLQMETMGLAEKSQVGLSVMTVGSSASMAYRKDSMFSVSSELTYANMKPYHSLTGSNINWTEAPQALSNVSTFKLKLGKSSMLKSLIQTSGSRSGMLYDNLNTHNPDSLHLQNTNVYTNNSFQTNVSEHTTANLAIGFMYDFDRIHLGKINLNTHLASIASSAYVKQYLGKNSLKYGLQYSFKNFNQSYDSVNTSFNARMIFIQPLVSSFVEMDYVFTKRMVFKPGVRAEYSFQNNEFTLQPRASMAYKTSANAKFSLACGVFRQLQADDYMKFNSGLQSSQAFQYILNYQYQYNNRLFRTELYAKQYLKLIQYQALNNPNPSTYLTSGNGSAYGIDLFFRDTKTIPNGDFWISYSFIHTTRKYKDYPTIAQPDYVSPHSFSMVYKQFFSKINTQIGASYLFSSSKQYNNPNDASFMASSLPSIHDISLSFSYLTRFFGQAIVVHGSVSNILGLNQVYGYRFADKPDETGKYSSSPIGSVAKRMIFLGVFMNL